MVHWIVFLISLFRSLTLLVLHILNHFMSSQRPEIFAIGPQNHWKITIKTTNWLNRLIRTCAISAWQHRRNQSRNAKPLGQQNQWHQKLRCFFANWQWQWELLDALWKDKLMNWGKHMRLTWKSPLTNVKQKFFWQSHKPNWSKWWSRAKKKEEKNDTTKWQVLNAMISCLKRKWQWQSGEQWRLLDSQRQMGTTDSQTIVGMWWMGIVNDQMIVGAKCLPAKMMMAANMMGNAWQQCWWQWMWWVITVVDEEWHDRDCAERQAFCVSCCLTFEAQLALKHQSLQVTWWPVNDELDHWHLFSNCSGIVIWSFSHLATCTMRLIDHEEGNGPSEVGREHGIEEQLRPCNCSRERPWTTKACLPGVCKIHLPDGIMPNGKCSGGKQFCSILASTQVRNTICDSMLNGKLSHSLFPGKLMWLWDSCLHWTSLWNIGTSSTRWDIFHMLQHAFQIDEDLSEMETPQSTLPVAMLSGQQATALCPHWNFAMMWNVFCGVNGKFFIWHTATNCNVFNVLHNVNSHHRQVPHALRLTGPKLSFEWQNCESKNCLFFVWMLLAIWSCEMSFLSNFGTARRTSICQIHSSCTLSKDSHKGCMSPLLLLKLFPWQMWQMEHLCSGFPLHFLQSSTWQKIFAVMNPRFCSKWWILHWCRDFFWESDVVWSHELHHPHLLLILSAEPCSNTICSFEPFVSWATFSLFCKPTQCPGWANFHTVGENLTKHKPKSMGWEKMKVATKDLEKKSGSGRTKKLQICEVVLSPILMCPENVRLHKLEREVKAMQQWLLNTFPWDNSESIQTKLSMTKFWPSMW